MSSGLPYLREFVVDASTGIDTPLIVALSAPSQGILTRFILTEVSGPGDGFTAELFNHPIAANPASPDFGSSPYNTSPPFNEPFAPDPSASPYPETEDIYRIGNTLVAPANGGIAVFERSYDYVVQFNKSTYTDLDKAVTLTHPTNLIWMRLTGVSNSARVFRGSYSITIPTPRA